jgi:predicted DCC family thiol-disulfide oxidoreductase YuxK
MTRGDPPEPLVLYDGVCGLCDRTVRFMLARDGGRLFYAPLQGETAARMRTLHPEIPATLESVVLIDDGRVHLRSKAFLYGARYLDPPWRWAYALRWLPAAVLDVVYNAVARVRYRVWGRLDRCRTPSTEERAKLLP